MDGYRILMVDDDEGQADQMAAALRRVPRVRQFDAARHAAEALDKLGPARDAFDLILMDQQWSPEAFADPALLTDAEGRLDGPAKGPPAWDRQGFGILRFLRANGVKAPVVFCTRVGNWRTEVEEGRAGEFRYYPKDELLNNPEWVLFPLEQGVEDRAYVRRLMDQLRLDRDKFTEDWLADCRPSWGRQWASIATALLERAAALGWHHLASGRREMASVLLPPVLAQFREAMGEAALLDFAARNGADAAEARYVEPFWLVRPASAGAPWLAVLDPSAQIPDPQAPEGWPATTARWHGEVPTLVAGELKAWSVGPTDPYWGVGHLHAVAFRPDAGGGSGSGQPQGQARRGPAMWQAFPEWAGRVGAPAADFWPELARRCKGLDEQAEFRGRAASLPALFLLAGADAGTGADGVPVTASPPDLRVVPFPRSLVAKTVLERLERPPRQLLLGLHRGGDPGPPNLPLAKLEAELKHLPRVEVWRGGWADAFEESTLRVVLDVMEQAPDPAGRPRCAWLATEFKHVRNGRKLTVWLQEFDLVILAPQGICLLECKDSKSKADQDYGVGQIAERMDQIWAHLRPDRGRPAKCAGAFLKPVLVGRLAGMGPEEEVPSDVLRVAPPTLRHQLKPVRGRNEAERVVGEFYDEFDPFEALGAREFHPARLLQGHRRGVPEVLGFVVVPGGHFFENRQRQSLPVYVLDREQALPERLKQWLRLPPAFTPDQQAKVSEALHHLSVGGDTTGLRELQGFTPHERGANLPGGWQVHRGHSAWSDAPQTWLVRTVGAATKAPALAAIGAWPATALREWACEVRGLDARGLPAEKPRHVRRLAVVAAGDVKLPEDLRRLLAADALAAAEALWRLGSDGAVAQGLGASGAKPLPLAQQAARGQRWRYAWLPGEPAAKKLVPTGAADGPAMRDGVGFVLDVLADWLGSYDDPAVRRVRDVLAEAAAAARDLRRPPPDAEGIAAALATARAFASI